MRGGVLKVHTTGLLKAYTLSKNRAVGGIVIAKLLGTKSPEKDVVMYGGNLADRLFSFSPLPTGGYVPYSKLYSKVAITVYWIRGEPHRITLTR